jgi:hypothetical protein
VAVARALWEGIGISSGGRACQFCTMVSEVHVDEMDRGDGRRAGSES